MEEKLYIFGAGASVDSGIPLVRDILCTILNDIEINYSEHESSFGTLEQSLFTKNYEKVFELIDRFGKTNMLELYREKVIKTPELITDDHIKNFSSFRFEELLTKIDECINSNSNLDTYSPEQLFQIKPFVHYVIFNTLQRCQINENRTYKNFIKNFLPIGMVYNLVSFNYDTLLDTALSDVYCFENYQKNSLMPWTYGATFDYKDEGFLNYDNCNNKIFPLLKPHGSFNWAYCDNCRKTSVYYDLSYCTCCELEKKQCPICKSKSCKTILLPPAKEKNQELNLLKAIKQKTCEAFARSREIVIIGYSAPKEDKEIQDLIIAMSNKPDVTVVNTSIEDIKRIAKLFENNCKNFRGLKMSFKEFVDSFSSQNTLEYIYF